MRIEAWNPNRADAEFENVAIERLIQAANVVANSARSKCPVGTVTRPMYKTGPYAGQPWTSRDAGRLKKSIRVVRQKTKSGKAFSRKRNVRVYAGTFLTPYANTVEHRTPFLRTALASSMSEVKEITGAK
jgi:hypothetical protein